MAGTASNTQRALSPAIRLRKATEADCRTLFTWRNDPWVVRFSTSGRCVTWAEHRRWFEWVQTDRDVLLFIIETEGDTPCGMVRLMRRDDRQAVVSVYLLESFTGRGIGVIALQEGCKRSFFTWGVAVVTAYIRSENIHSRNAFAKAGFQPDPESRECPEGHITMSLRKENADGT